MAKREGARKSNGALDGIENKSHQVGLTPHSHWTTEEEVFN